MLLMKAATARHKPRHQQVRFYSADTELAYYVNQKVNIKWDIDDVTQKLYVYDMDGKKICEAVSAELLAFGALFSGGAGEASARSETKQARGQGVSSGGASPPLRAAARGRCKTLRMQWA